MGRALYRRYPPAVEEALTEQRILIFAVCNALRTDGRPSSLNVLCGLELGRKPVRCF